MAVKKNKAVKISLPIIVAILGLFGFLIYQAYERSMPTLRSKLGSNIDFYDKKDLSSHNYAAYQQQLAIYAQYAASIKDYKDANKLMDKVAKNVPESQIQRNIYRVFISLAKQNHDTASYTRYSKAYILLLKQQGFPLEANYYQAQLDKGQ